MDRIVVTGDAGFIGTHLKKTLRKQGYQVTGWDLVDGRDIRLMQPEDLYDVDYIFHLAAKAKVPYSVDNPLETHDHNVNGTLNVLRCAKEANVKRVIYSASSSAYGDQKVLPLKEFMAPNPMSPYGIQKLVGEYYCKVFSEVYGLETVSLRYFNVYGDGMPLMGGYSACIALFLNWARQNKPLQVLGGKQKRDFTFVEDAVNANKKAMLSPKVGHGEVINVGSGVNWSINDIAEIISDNIEYKPQRKGEPMETLADINLAKELLDWEPTMSLGIWLRTKLKND